MRSRSTFRFFFAAALATAPVAAAAFPGTAVTPTIYQVTLKKVEICTGSDGVGSCEGSFVLGSSTRSFDIAAVGAGAAVGSYANLSTLPVGSTFTHIRVTVDAAITARASGTDGVGPPTCYTQAAGGGSAGTAASATFAGGPPVTGTIYVPHIGTLNTSGGARTLTEADFQTTGARGYIKRPNDSDVVITYSLTAPYTSVLNKQPQVTVKFNVTGAVGILWTGAACDVFPEPPSVTITVQ
jgi:hypothetical protein